MYMSKQTFGGRPATLGAAILVHVGAARQPRAEVFASEIVPGFVERIDASGMMFRLTDGRAVDSGSLDGYDVTRQRPVSADGGFVETSIDTIDRMPLRSWTWPPPVLGI